jgi:hypothetical protein
LAASTPIWQKKEELRRNETEGEGEVEEIRW